MPKLALAIFLAISMVPSVASAAAVDISNGRYLAEQYCSQCHNIEPDAPSKLSPPSFQAIATYRTSGDIFAHIINPSLHGGMPELMWHLTMAQFQDVLGYIGSLDKGPATSSK